MQGEKDSVHLRAEWTAGPSGNFPLGDWACREYVRRCRQRGGTTASGPQLAHAQACLLCAQNEERPSIWDMTFALPGKLRSMEDDAEDLADLGDDFAEETLDGLELPGATLDGLEPADGDEPVEGGEPVGGGADADGGVPDARREAVAATADI